MSALQIKDHLAEHLAQLRDLALKGFTPQVAAPSDADGIAGTRFTTERDLFKPTGEEARRLALKRLMEQETGLQIGSHARLQWDFTQFRTVDDRQDYDVKLGIRVGFH